MTKAEAETTIKIFLQADSGCAYCASGLCEEFVRAFPEWMELAKTIYIGEYPDKQSQVDGWLEDWDNWKPDPEV